MQNIQGNEAVMNISLAKPLLLSPLSAQISEAGGSGFNCDVESIPVTGSFSVLQRFKTAAGDRYILTRNEYQVGVIDEEENHFVMYNGDTGEYTLVTPRAHKVEPYKILMIKSLGHSFDAMLAALKELWPNRQVWKLTDPQTVIK